MAAPSEDVKETPGIKNADGEVTENSEESLRISDE